MCFYLDLGGLRQALLYLNEGWLKSGSSNIMQSRFVLTVRGMAAAVVSRGVFSVRLPGGAAVFAPQASAARLAFELSGVSKDVNCVVMSGASSCLMSVRGVGVGRP